MIQRRKRRISAGSGRMLFFIEKREHQYLALHRTATNGMPLTGIRRLSRFYSTAKSRLSSRNCRVRGFMGAAICGLLNDGCFTHQEMEANTQPTALCHGSLRFFKFS